MADDSRVLSDILQELKKTNEKIDSLASNVDFYIRSELDNGYEPAGKKEQPVSIYETQGVKFV